MIHFFTADLPSPPTSLRVRELTRDSVQLSWTPPEYTGDVPITGYTIEQLDGKAVSWRTTKHIRPGTTSTNITDLIQGYGYHFRVRAENAAGLGGATALASPVVPYQRICKSIVCYKGYNWREGI